MKYALPPGEAIKRFIERRREQKRQLLEMDRALINEDLFKDIDLSFEDPKHETKS